MKAALGEVRAGRNVLLTKKLELDRIKIEELTQTVWSGSYWGKDFIDVNCSVF